MQMSQMLRGSAMAMALLLPVGSAYAQGHDRPDAAPPEWPAGEPLDLTTPEPDADKPKGSNPLAGKPSAPSWDSKVGIDYRKPSIPGASFQPEQLTAGAIPDQSTGVAWATGAAARCLRRRSRHRSATASSNKPASAAAPAAHRRRYDG